MRTRDHSLIANAASLLLCGLLAGLVVAAAAFPALAMTGLTLKAGADTFEQMPTNFDVLPSAQISNLYASDGTTFLASMYDENRREVKLSDVNKVMQQAMVAAEDKKFYQHHGVDLKGVARAFVNNQASGDKQGASTLTMQYIRQVIKYSAKTPEQVLEATEQTPARKLREMKYAIALEKQLSKEQILEKYLNIASFGEGAYGIWAASQVYYGKPPSELNLAESALLASLVKAPSIYNPATKEGKPEALARSREYTLPNMLALGYITQAQFDEAVKVEPKIIGQRPPQGCTEVQHAELGAGFFCDYLLRWWGEQSDFGENQYERENRLLSGGYKIVMSLDMSIQQTAYEQAKKTAVTDPHAVLLAVVEPGTGRIKALAANRIFSNDQTGNGGNTNPAKKGQIGNYPNTTVPLITGGGDQTGYQSGSVFKIFTVAAALEKGYPLNTIMPTPQVARTSYIVGSDSAAACPGSNNYCVSNANKDGSMNGNQNMWSAFGKSANTYFVPMQEKVGAENVVNMAKRLGIKFRSKSGDMANPGDYEMSENPSYAHMWGPFTLGVSSTTPLDVANAWATLAADGTYCEPSPVQAIYDRDGNKVAAGDPKCSATPVVSPDVARGAIDAARCPAGDKSATTQCPSWGTVTEARGRVGRPLAGKTGTTDSDRTATLTLTTKQLAISGFMLDPDYPMRNNGGDHTVVNNAVINTLKQASANLPFVEFTTPSSAITNGNQANLVSVPSVKCKSLADAKKTLTSKGFDPVEGDQVVSDCPAGTAAGTDPTGKTVKGGSVTILISKGPDTKPTKQR